MEARDSEYCVETAGECCVDVRASECSVKVRTSEHYVDVRASDLCGSHTW